MFSSGLQSRKARSAEAAHLARVQDAAKTLPSLRAPSSAGAVPHDPLDQTRFASIQPGWFEEAVSDYSHAAWRSPPSGTRGEGCDSEEFNVYDTTIISLS
jgi:hypothetical protein